MTRLMTRREAALAQIIDRLIASVEEMGCTCADNDQRNRLHAARGRRRTDSSCSGVRAAVAADLQRRRALRLKD